MKKPTPYTEILKERIKNVLEIAGTTELDDAENIEEIIVVLNTMFGGVEQVREALRKKHYTIERLVFEARKENLEKDAQHRILSCNSTIDTKFRIVEEILQTQPNKLLLTLQDLKQDLQLILKKDFK